MKRREFLKIRGAAARAAACGPKDARSVSGMTGEEGPEQMLMRENPKNGDRISALGFGCMRWPMIKDANGKITVKESTLYDGIKDITTAQTGSTDSQSANNKAFANKWYDLTGRQVSQPAQGLYIINGQKVMIK